MIRTFQRRMAGSIGQRTTGARRTMALIPRVREVESCCSFLFRRHGSESTTTARRFSSIRSSSSSSHNRNQPTLPEKDDNKNDDDVVTTTIDSQGIAYVTLNRPHKLNALNLAMFRGLQQAALQLANRSRTKQQQQPPVRVVILRGAGRAFCTGLDVPSILQFQNGQTPWQTSAELLEKKPLPIVFTNNSDTTTNSSSSPPESTTEHKNDNEPTLSNDSIVAAQTTNLAQDVGYLWRQLPVPVICSLHGMCYGGGLQIALGADVRLCHPETKLSIMETKWGLIPDMSLTVTLRELVPMDVVKEWLFTGRIVRGTEAGGLVTRCCDDPHAAADELARELIQKSPDALRLGKQLIQQTWAQRYVATEQECLQWETDYQKQLLLSWNQVAASARNFGLKLPYRTTGND